ncbi:MAG: alpha-galactosidase [Clostridia bacterium]|nr:alpha-galactosidase [Clostridia bacterium]
MYNFKPLLCYKVNGEKRSSSNVDTADYSLELSVNEGKIKCVLHPKKEIELSSFSLETRKSMSDDEFFFVNGFQSRSTSPEVKKTDAVKGIIFIANITKFTRHLAAMSGDYLFEKYDNVPGHFHSFTYTYFRKGNDIELFGSMSERNGYTVFEMDNGTGKFFVKKDVDGVITGEDYVLLDVSVICKPYDDAFDEYFASMNLRKSKIKHMSGYTSWYNYFQKIDENIILRDLEGIDRVKEDVSIFQIDDGYETYVGDWLDVDKNKFPAGMKFIADKIHERGYNAGIWVAPFSCQRVSKVAKTHPEWLIKDSSGKPMWGCFAWGGAYTLDMYNPEAAEYIRNCFDVILNEWGYDMVKLDFLYSQAIYPRNGKSRGQIMCEAMDFLRECVGEDKLILGCGVPLGPAFGVVDACRISCDVDLVYAGKFYDKLGVNREVPSAQNSMNNSIFRRHLNQRVFCNDPDVFFLRKTNLSFTDEQKYILGKVNNLFGDVLFVSDNAGDYGEKEIDMVRQFFKENDSKVISAGYTDKDIITVRYLEGDKETAFSFNMKKGVIIK